jgi:5S rRNA maturation endonuclease (ribonuclease M5)
MPADPSGTAMSRSEARHVGAPIDSVVAALDQHGCQPRRVGRRLQALCPAHDDREPSLSLDEGDDGRALLHCHAGCPSEAIVAALGMRMEQLFPPCASPITPSASERPSARFVAHYDYVDEADELLFQVCRRSDKHFLQRRPDGQGGWLWQLGETRRVLFRLPRVLETAAAGGTIYVCEGEKDVQALERAGVVATCNPGGVGKWRAEYAEALLGADAVIIIADRDAPGVQHALTIRESLLDRIPHVIRTAATGKDAADHLDAGHGIDDFVDLDFDEQPVARATPDPSHVVRLHFQDDLADLPEPEWYLDHLLPMGETGMLFGPWGSRKSLLALDWANRVAIEHGLVVYVTPEGFRGVAKRWAAWREHNGVKRVERLALVRHAVQMRDPKDVAEFAAAIASVAAARREPVALIVIDTLARSNAGGNENGTEDMTAWLDAADRLRLAFGDACSVLVVHHDGNERGRPRGASAIAQWVTFMLSIVALPGGLSELRVEKRKDGERVAVRFRQVYAADSVVLVEESRKLLDDAAPATRGPAVDALRFAGWLAECGGVVTLKHAADQFGKSAKTIRRWTRTPSYSQHGVMVENGRIVLATGTRTEQPVDAQ